MRQLFGDKSLRALQFVHKLNEQGIVPTISDANVFIEAWMVNDFDPLTEGYCRATVDYLIGARLLKKNGARLTLSPAGEVLLRVAGNTDVAKHQATPVEVVGRMTDPFIYAELLKRIDDFPIRW